MIDFNQLNDTARKNHIANVYPNITLHTMNKLNDKINNYFKIFDYINIKKTYDENIPLAATYINWENVKDYHSLYSYLLFKYGNISIDIITDLYQDKPYNRFKIITELLYYNNRPTLFKQIYIDFHDVIDDFIIKERIKNTRKIKIKEII